MAKYTELYADYLLNGGSIPTAFNLIDGFNDLFTAYYCDKEIGFETETIFSIKLDLLASTILPQYKKHIDLLNMAYLKAENPTRVHYEIANTVYNFGTRVKNNNNTYGENKTENSSNIGSQENKETTLPFNAENANPSSIVNQGARADSGTLINRQHTDSFIETEQARNDNNKIERTINDSGYNTPIEALEAIERLNKDISILMLELLKKFENLFMKVY